MSDLVPVVNNNNVKIVLVMIVRQEEKIIKRCLSSCSAFIDAACIIDTNPKPDESSVMKKCIQEIWDEINPNKPLKLTSDTFQNFGWNRTRSVDMAREWIKNDLKYPLNRTFGLLLDADFVLHNDPCWSKSQLSNPCYMLVQQSFQTKYANVRLIRMDISWICKGRTHEYWTTGAIANQFKPAYIAEKQLYIEDLNDGGCKSDKYVRDERLLREDLQDNPKNVRAQFYLGRTLMKLKQWDEAIKHLSNRAQAPQGSGNASEKWFALFNVAQCYHEKYKVNPKVSNDKQGVYFYMAAINMMPTRVEPYLGLIDLFILMKWYPMAWMMYRQAQDLLKASPFERLSPQQLFVDIMEYKFGLDRRIMELAQYLGEVNFKSGMLACMRLLHQWDIMPNQFRNEAFQKSWLYQKPRFLSCETIAIQSNDPDLHPTNPSIVQFQNSWWGTIRLVNYTQKGARNYKILKKDNNIVKTRNMLVQYGQLTKLSPIKSVEVQDVMVNAPPLYPTKVQGFEDMRLFEWQNSLWFFAASCQTQPDNGSGIVPCMVAGKIDHDTGQIKTWLVMKSPDLCVYPPLLTNVPIVRDKADKEPSTAIPEKNWLPWTDYESPFNNKTEFDIPFIYSLSFGQMIICLCDIRTGDTRVDFVMDIPVHLNLRGGSMPRQDPRSHYWYVLAHSFRVKPTNHEREYGHYWLRWRGTPDNQTSISQLFTFQHTGVEFGMGHVWDEQTNQFMVVWGHEDNQARCGWFNPEDPSWLWYHL